MGRKRQQQLTNAAGKTPDSADLSAIAEELATLGKLIESIPGVGRKRERLFHRSHRSKTDYHKPVRELETSVKRSVARIKSLFPPPSGVDGEILSKPFSDLDALSNALCRNGKVGVWSFPHIWPGMTNSFLSRHAQIEREAFRLFGCLTESDAKLGRKFRGPKSQRKDGLRKLIERTVEELQWELGRRPEAREIWDSLSDYDDDRILSPVQDVDGYVYWGRKGKTSYKTFQNRLTEIFRKK